MSKMCYIFFYIQVTIKSSPLVNNVTLISFIAQKLHEILAIKCYVVAELTGGSKGGSCKWKKKHTHRHTQIPFYLKTSAGTTATSN